MDAWQWMQVAFAAAAMGYFLLQAVKSRCNFASRGSSSDARADVASESSARGIVRQLEVRAYDYSREVEARIDNRLTVLDQLIVDADREIESLQRLLNQSAVNRELNAAEQQRCFQLQDAGCSIDEIARCLNATPDAVHSALDQWQPSTKRAA
jgi:hypothetical protein